MAFSTAVDEKKLIEDLQRESTAHKAFELLMRTFSEPLYWQIRKMVYDHDDANDLLQNVFLKAWNNIHNFRGDAKLSTWLYKIAVNEAINFVNREKNRRNISADTDDTSFLLNRLEADEYFDGDELQKQLLDEIAKLPEKQRLVFNMKYFDEMKYEEISEVLGTSVGALKASYHHAVKKLSKAFGLSAIFLCMIVNSLVAFAVPASPEPATYTQPDGSVIEFRILGDENSHIMVGLDGTELRYDSQGFLRPVARLNNEAFSGNPQPVTAPKYLISGAAFPAKDNPRALVILAEFPDTKFSVDDPRGYYHRILNLEGFSENGATGSARDFFVENSLGRFTPAFDVYGPVMMKHPMSYYGANDQYGYDLHPEEVVIECMNGIDNNVDLSIYDTNSDGEIDNVYIFYAGYGEQDTGRVNVIWPHSADLLDFNLDLDYYFDGVLLNRYAMSNELKANTTIPDGIGTFVHEFSHVLGLPDLYSTTYSGAFTPGKFSTMDNAPYNNNGRTPAYYSIFERMCLGWLEPEEFSISGDYELRPIGESNSGYIIHTENPEEFYLIENRQLTGFDKYIPGHGMLIWHIDFAQDIWDRNIVNNRASHQRVDLIEADNRRTDITRSSDPFPGKSGITSFTSSTTPALRSWADLPLSVTDITDIREDDDGTIRFSIKGSSSLGAESATIDYSTSLIKVNGGSANNLSMTHDAVIFDLQGRKVAVISPGASVAMSAGIYIAVVEQKTGKIIVR